MGRLSFFTYCTFFVLLFTQPFYGVAQKKKKKKDKQESESHSQTISEKDLETEYLFIKGEGKYIIKDYSSALKYFNSALNLAPDNDAINYKIAQCQYKLDNPDKALEKIKTAINLNPSIKEYYLFLIELYAQDEDLTKSAITYEQMLKNCLNCSEYHLDAASLYQKMGQINISQKVYYSQSGENKSSTKKIKEIDKEFEINYNSAIHHLHEFELFFGKSKEITLEIEKLYLGLNEFDKALEEAEKLALYYPNDAEYEFHVIELLMNNERKNEAITRLESLCKRNPNTFRYQIALASFYQQNNQKSKSKQTLENLFSNPDLSIDEKVKLISTLIQENNPEQISVAESLCLITIDSHPKAAQAYSIYGDVLYVQEKRVEARDQYYKAVKTDSSVYLIWQQIVIIDAELQDNQQLVAHCEEAINIFPNKPVLWFYKGLGHQIQNEDSMAIEAYENGLPHTENNSSLREEYFAQLGDTYFSANRKDDSYKAYDAALTINPNNIHVLNNYSYFLSLEKTGLKQAKRMSKKTILMQPNEPTYLDTYGWILYQMGEYENAKIYLEKALINSQDGTILEHYGDTLYQLGKKELAIENWKKAKETGGASTLIDKKIRDEKLYE